MSRKMILVVFIIVILTAVFIVFLNCGKMNTQKIESVSYQLLGRYSVDTNGIRNRLRIMDKTPFTFYIQVKNTDNIKEHLIKEYSFVPPDIEFNWEDKYVFITFGRELINIEYEYLGEPYNANSVAKADITFGEEYQQDTIFVYLMDKVLIGEETLYIMRGSDGIFWGHTYSDINEINWSLEK